MSIDTLRIISTVVLFLTFIGIFVWAWSKKRKPDFNEAANLPFNEPEQPTPLATPDKQSNKAGDVES